MIIPDPTILLVDDSDNDGMLMRIVFERAGLVRSLQYARNGEEAMAYLRGDGAHADRQRFPLPTVMLLDLNMPRKNGFEVLAWVREQPALRQLHVYILSASGRPDDIQRAYDLGANSYLVKPGNLDGLMQLARCVLEWVGISHFAPLADPIYEPALSVAGDAAGDERG